MTVAVPRGLAVLWLAFAGCAGAGSAQRPEPERHAAAPVAFESVVRVRVARILDSSGAGAAAVMGQTLGPLVAPVAPFLQDLDRISWLTRRPPVDPAACPRAAHHASRLFERAHVRGGPPPTAALLARCRDEPGLARCWLAAADWDGAQACVPAILQHVAIAEGRFEASALASALSSSIRAQRERAFAAAVPAVVAVLGPGRVAWGDAAAIEAVKRAPEGLLDDGLARLARRVDAEAAVLAVTRNLPGMSAQGGAASLAVAPATLRLWVGGRPAADVRKRLIRRGGPVDVLLPMVFDLLHLAPDRVERLTVENALRRLLLQARIEDADPSGWSLTGVGSEDLRPSVAAFVRTGLARSLWRWEAASAIREVEGAFARLEAGAAAHFEASGACALPGVPACAPAAAGTCRRLLGRYPADRTAWRDPAWRALRFELSAPHAFRYCVRLQDGPRGRELVLAAHGDLDCDGVESTLERRIPIAKAADGTCRLSGPSRSSVLRPGE